MLTIGREIKMYVPGYRTDEVLSSIIGRIVGRWGGCTLADVGGVWTDKAGEVVREPMVQITCSISDYTSDARDWWYDLSDVVRHTFEQEAVFLSDMPQDAMIIGHGTREFIGLLEAEDG